MDVTGTTLVDISIEHVSIEGFGVIDSAAMRQNLQRDLARLVSERGLPGAWRQPGARADVRTTLDWDGRGGTEAFSAALAERIYVELAS
ncbi:MAG: hypothetical protein WCF04_14215 [Candidatus Nanopelagicales bacterium]